MDCPDAQAKILDSFAAPRTPAWSVEVEHHLAECDNCRRFLESQQQLDLQLTLAISAPSLSPRFRQSVIESLRPQPYYLLPEFLPDTAHIAGCIFATALSIFVLPFPPGSIFLAGMAFTVVTYFVQSVFRSSLESWEESR